MSFSITMGPGHHHHRPHRHHPRFGFGPFKLPRISLFSPPAIRVVPCRPRPISIVPATPLSETGRKFVNIGAAAIAIGVIMSVVGVCLAPVSFGATGALCGIGGALFLGGLGASIYGHIRG